jgi:hypothetical protein
MAIVTLVINFIPDLKKPMNVNLKTLVPVLNEQEGFYQLGPLQSCNDFFMLSVTIAYTNNLPQVCCLVAIVLVVI